MTNFDHVTKETMKENNTNWPQIPDPPYRILIMGGSGYGKSYSLLNLKSYQPDIDEIYSYAKDSSEANYQLLINKQQSAGVNHLNYFKAFTDYSNDMDDI